MVTPPKREIPRYPSPPKLSPEIIELLNKLCFKEDDPILESARSDTIFVFGTDVSPIELSATLDPLFQAKVSDTLIFTGGFIDYDDAQPQNISIARSMQEAVKHRIPPGIQVILQEKSQNTLEDVVFSLDYIRQVKSIWVVSRNFHAGRSHLTLKKYLPSSHLYNRSIAEVFPDPCLMVSREHWHEYPKQIAIVYGEYLRIKKYGERGDIAFDEVRGLVETIDSHLAA